MAFKSFRPVAFAMLVALPLGATGTALAAPASAPRIKLCYNKKTTVVRFSKFGNCAIGFRAIVLAKAVVAVAGPRGLTGPRGMQGVAGVAGEDGLAGSAGANGAAGPQGVMGPAGPAGGTGVAGGTGGTGPQGNPGVNEFHTVTATSTGALGPLTASCAAGEIVTGGGFLTSTSASGATVSDSYPTTARDGWVVNYIGLGPSIQVTVYAICVAGSNS